MKSAHKHTLIVILALFAVLACMGASQATASTTIQTPEPTIFPWQRWVEESKMPTPDLTITLREEPCPGAPWVTGCVNFEQYEIYFKPNRILKMRDRSRRPLFLFHEVGHFFDREVLTDQLRDRFRAIFGLEGKPWDRARQKPPPGEPIAMHPGPPMEKFAQGYAECALKGPTIAKRPAYPVRYRYRPTPAQHAAVCRLVEDAWRRR